MKLLTLPLLAAAAGFSVVYAAPLKVVMIDIEAIRFGHPAAGAMNPRPDVYVNMAQGAPIRKPCGRKSNQAIEISNTVRKALGFPLIESAHHATPHLVLEPSPSREGRPYFYDSNRGWRPTGISSKPEHLSFYNRLQVALMELGPWEGKLVAFVLGCGIGVLLRMIWVICAISYRAFSRADDGEEVLFATVDAEDIIVPPPRYEVTIIDEKKDTKDFVTPMA